ncbi:MAG: hypothetical protein E7773_10130 [Sphingomonas sp.]|uniref:hypothetical protein n=1 Tax=Sphingomonas sp. TaxID=28214 RepID=UPI00120935C8|nr:hypothetical protein [Sphingomonas sp.]THD35695.1 MAG: hypothetical protein E7773_10130 [Sphingomonas sp.]
MADGDTSAWIGLAGVALGGTISTIASFALAFTERKKFARDRIWDIRRGVYTKIIAVMGDIERRAEDHRFNFTDDAGGENYFDSPAYRQMEGEIVNLEARLDRIITLNLVIMSKAMVKWHRDMIGELGELVEHPEAYEPFDVADVRHKIFKAQLDRVTDIAQRELGVPG